MTLTPMDPRGHTPQVGATHMSPSGNKCVVVAIDPNGSVNLRYPDGTLVTVFGTLDWPRVESAP